jgi:hypothetical protein
MIYVVEDNSLRLRKSCFKTKDGQEFEKSQLTDEQYKIFCNALESERIISKIIWPEMDERYNEDIKL